MDHAPFAGEGRRVGVAWPWVGAVAFAAAAVLAWVFRDLRHDDAFVTFQYARHVAEGTGFVFNPGERFLGTSSPLHALVLALLYPLAGGSLPVVAVGLGALGLAVQAVAAWSLLRRGGAWVALACGLALLAGLSRPFDWFALETNLFAGLVLATFAAVEAGRPAAAGVLLGLSFLCRYDAGLFVPVVALLDARLHRRFPKALLAWSLATVLPWLAWATWYFGSFLPHTLGAKEGLTAPGAYLVHYLQHFQLSTWGTQSAAVLLVSGVLWTAGLAWSFFRAPAFAAFLASGALNLLAYAWIGPPEDQHWHGYLPQVAFAAGIIASLGWVVERGSAGRLATVLASMLLVGWAVSGTVSRASTYRDDFWLGRRHAEYEAVAAFVNERFPADARFMAAEVGTLGWLTRRHMLDPFGLIHETNDWPLHYALDAWIDLMVRNAPDVMLVDDEAVARRLEERTPFRIVRVFPWKSPRAVLMAPPGK